MNKFDKSRLSAIANRHNSSFVHFRSTCFIQKIFIHIKETKEDKLKTAFHRSGPFAGYLLRFSQKEKKNREHTARSAEINIDLHFYFRTKSNRRLFLIKKKIALFRLRTCCFLIQNRENNFAHIFVNVFFGIRNENFMFIILHMNLLNCCYISTFNHI